jgi:tripartite-type tricarboxylate transporter receptor subunit TctC
MILVLVLPRFLRMFLRAFLPMVLLTPPQAQAQVLARPGAQQHGQPRPAAGLPAPWPQRPIRLVLPQAAGAGADAFARPLAAALGQQLGQPVVLDHRPGLGGGLAAELVAKSTADGHTFLMGSVEQVIAPALQPLQPPQSPQPPAGHDLQRDLAPVTLLAIAPGVMVTGAAQDIASVGELLRRQRTAAATLSYASGGKGSFSHLAAERYRQASATDAVHRPQGGTQAGLEALRAGRADFMIAPLGVVLPWIRDGRLRALAVAGGSRSFALPSVPTLAEAGVAGVQLPHWHALWSPAGTPPAIRLAMQQAVATVLDRKELVDAWNGLGAERGGQPEHVLTLLIRSESLAWGQAIKGLGVGPNQ